MKWPQKVRQIFIAKLLKQPKGLVVCELQAASPSVLPWSCGCCSNPDIQRVPAWSAPWIEILANITIHFWVSQRNFISPHCLDSCFQKAKLHTGADPQWKRKTAYFRSLSHPAHWWKRYRQRQRICGHPSRSKHGKRFWTYDPYDAWDCEETFLSVPL